MKYRKTIMINKPGVQEALAAGTLKLQRGQWVQCFDFSDKKARYIGQLGNGSVWLAHWQGSAEATAEKFNACVEVMRNK